MTGLTMRKHTQLNLNNYELCYDLTKTNKQTWGPCTKQRQHKKQFIYFLLPSTILLLISLSAFKRTCKATQKLLHNTEGYMHLTKYFCYV